MRKFFFYFSLLLLGILVTATLAWINKKIILTHFLSKQLHTSVSMKSFDLNKTGMNISQLWIHNPPPSKTPTAFKAQELSIDTTVDDILSTPLVIEEISIQDIFVGLELYSNKKNDTNWSRILKEDSKKKKSSRPYLIRHIVLKNLTVELTKADGSTKRYPTIPRMDFYNISNETGFPIEEIQKAIFNLMLQDLFKQLNLDQLFKTFLPNLPENSPLKLIPGLFK